MKDRPALMKSSAKLIRRPIAATNFVHATHTNVIVEIVDALNTCYGRHPGFRILERQI